MPRPWNPIRAIMVMPFGQKTHRETERNGAKATINWRFTIADARIKLKNVYPSIEMCWSPSPCEPAYCLWAATPNDAVGLPGGGDKGGVRHHDLYSIDNGYLSDLIFQQEWSKSPWAMPRRSGFFQCSS